MSGIGGIVRCDGGPVAERVLRMMMRLVAHRGPDGLTWRIDDAVGLGHALHAMRRSELASAGFEMVHFAHQPYGHAVGKLRLDGAGGS